MPAAKAVFIDSTTFLYTLDESEPSKGRIAESWLNTLASENVGVANLQVLDEVASVITRKSARFGDRDPFFEVDAFAQFGSSPLSVTAAVTARDLFRRHRYSWWDCLLLASALELGCTHFLSEDMQDGQRVMSIGERGLTIVDPFAHSPEQILSST